MRTVELARDNYLRPNGLGGVIIRQSDLSSWSRCQLQKYYYDRARHDPDAPQPRGLSATIYGTLVHYCLMLLEQHHHEGRDDALDVAVATFHHYWTPENLPVLTGERIEEWLPRQTWTGLKARGQIALNDYYRLLRSDPSDLLALEYQFAVPIQVGDRTHTLTGTIDRLSVRRQSRKPYLSLDDYKTGKQPTYLRYNMQGSAYAYATTQPEFWHGWDDSGLGEMGSFPRETVDSLQAMFHSWGYRLHDADPADLRDASRRFRWVNIQEIKFADGGWRHARDYARLGLAIDGYIRACEAGAYTVTTTGEVCAFCPFKRTCGGLGLPSDREGEPR